MRNHCVSERKGRERFWLKERRDGNKEEGPSTTATNVLIHAATAATTATTTTTATNAAPISAAAATNSTANDTYWKTQQELTFLISAISCIANATKIIYAFS